MSKTLIEERDQMIVDVVCPHCGMWTGRNNAVRIQQCAHCAIEFTGTNNELNNRKAVNNLHARLAKLRLAADVMLQDYRRWGCHRKDIVDEVVSALVFSSGISVTKKGADDAGIDG